MKKFAALAAVASVMAFGGTVAAGSGDDGDYPPGGTTPTTVATDPGGTLPETGSDGNDTLTIGAGALVAGAGLLAVTKLRRRSAAG